MVMTSGAWWMRTRSGRPDGRHLGQRPANLLLVAHQHHFQVRLAHGREHALDLDAGGGVRPHRVDRDAHPAQALSSSFSMTRRSL